MYIKQLLSNGKAQQNYKKEGKNVGLRKNCAILLKQKVTSSL